MIIVIAPSMQQAEHHRRETGLKAKQYFSAGNPSKLRGILPTEVILLNPRLFPSKHRREVYETVEIFKQHGAEVRIVTT